MKRSSLFIGVLAIALILIALPAYAAWAPAGLQGEDVTALAEDPGDATAWYAGTYGDYATVAYDPSGNRLWLARYDGPANSSDIACAIATDNAGWETNRS
jgi:hypothetical protein